MSKEDDFKTRMVGDTALMLILTGGVYTFGAGGIEGITVETTPAAFDATTKYPKPCAMVKQRARVPDGIINDTLAQVSSTSQVVEIFIYEDTGYTAIDAAIARLYILFHGYAFSDSFPVEWINLLDRVRDKGAKRWNSLAKMDFVVNQVIEA